MPIKKIDKIKFLMNWNFENFAIVIATFATIPKRI
jgi:hypothetical protein